MSERTQARAGAAVASLILQLLRRACVAHENGNCLGVRLDLAFDWNGVNLRPRGRTTGREWPRSLAGWRLTRITQLGVAHSRGGHETGCESIGVSLRELAQLVAQYDPSHVGDYLLEGVSACASELECEDRPPRGRELFEILQAEIQSRIHVSS